MLTMPVGVVWCESLKPHLLSKWGKVPVTISITALAARKYIGIIAQAGYLAVACGLAYSALGRVSKAVIGIPGLPWLGFAVAGGLVCVGTVLGMVLHRGAPAVRVFSGLRSLPLRIWRDWLDKKRTLFEDADDINALLFRDSKRWLATTGPFFFGHWILEAIETFLIISLLGVELDFTSVLGFEALLSFLRSVVFVLPAGLGVQDMGYLAFLTAFGVQDPVNVAAAFVLLKRLKELTVAGLGYLVFALSSLRTPRPSAAAVVAAEQA
jgi:uncharacterized membrane protein YbhN (UPF0104 family)